MICRITVDLLDIMWFLPSRHEVVLVLHLLCILLGTDTIFLYQFTFHSVHLKYSSVNINRLENDFFVIN